MGAGGHSWLEVLYNHNQPLPFLPKLKLAAQLRLDPLRGAQAVHLGLQIGNASLKDIELPFCNITLCANISLFACHFPHSPKREEKKPEEHRREQPLCHKATRVVTLLIFPHYASIAAMSFLFHKRTQKAMRWVWIVLAILIILSMVLAFSPGVLAF